MAASLADATRAALKELHQQTRTSTLGVPMAPREVEGLARGILTLDGVRVSRTRILVRVNVHDVARVRMLQLAGSVLTQVTITQEPCPPKWATADERWRYCCVCAAELDILDEAAGIMECPACPSPRD